MATANNDPTRDLSATAPEKRLTSPADRGLAPFSARSGRNSPRRPRAATQAPNAQPPLLLVGRLEGLTPSSLTVTANKDGSGPARSVPTDRVDYRKAKGFDAALKAGIAHLGFAAAQAAEVKDVNSNADLLAAIKRAGPRQVIYFGHAAGPGALWPGGTDVDPVDPNALAKAFPKGGPRPILLGCNAAGTSLVGAPPPANAVGLDRLLELDNLSAKLKNASVKAPTARDIEVSEIDLSVGAKGFAPQVRLPGHDPITPP
jgi:hypothetical protein